ncbi:MAG: type I glyceraldehyde-3-phosphate dehydrogenase [Halobacteriovoraceae bacterium]|nr:type I glyceraldehyde-3-phosphate dehydrogenase [Halobacteriovoraceae bacterium]MCB9095787.1 type I glyceraldehyde-3-phosphate dehydrogenase [Halobacteriovoraceae bacterium]
MSQVKVAINGMGRIGRALIREYVKRKTKGLKTGFDIVCVNNPGQIDIYAHLLKYDSVHRIPYGDVQVLSDSSLQVGNEKFHFYSEMQPQKIPWHEQGVNIVIDSSGVFRTGEALSQHLGDTVKKVVLCAPGKDIDGTFVMGINNETFDPAKHNIISNASCTTNCLAPVAKVLHDNLKIQSGFMTTVHAYTNDQNLLDNSHSDFRRARAAALSIIPTSTGAAKATGLVIPELKGKLDGYAVRVPTANVSMVDLTVNLEKKASAEEINGLMKTASETYLKNILAYTEEELVGVDFTGRPESSVFDSKLTNVIGNTAKIVSWYDNEIGFSNRVLDLVGYVGEKTWQ